MLTVDIPTHISPSQVSQLAQCPARYLLGRAYPPETTPVWNVLGTAVHTAIQAAIEDGITLYDTISLVKTLIGEHDPERIAFQSRTTKDNLVATAVGCVETWWDQVHPTGKNRLPEYEALGWPPQTESRFNLPGGPPVVVILDALYSTAFGPVVVDWKTGARSRSQMLQLYIYWWALRQSGIAKPEHRPRGWFHHLRSGKLQPFDWYPGDAVIQAQLWAADRTKRAGHYDPQPNDFCPVCQSQPHCPIFTGDMTDLDAARKAVRWVQLERNAA